MALTTFQSLFAVLGFILPFALGQDALGLSKGYINVSTRNFDIQIVRNAQVLASLRPKGESFDFLPFDFLPRRTRNGQYHWGDITYRYRQSGSNASWIDGDSATARKAVKELSTGALAASGLAPSLPTSPLNISREWIDVDGDLGLQFTVQNTGHTTLEIGSLGFPAEFNSIFTNRTASDTQKICSLSDPYIGMDAGHIRVAPLDGTGSALVVTPLGDSPMEAYRNLEEEYYDDTGYGSQTFEGFYEWQILTKAWAEKEWAGKQQWNLPSSRTLKPGQSLKFGVRFSVSKGGLREIDSAIKLTKTPVAVGVPGYIVPRDSIAQLFLHASSNVTSLTAEPADFLSVAKVAAGSYSVTPSSLAWGRVRLTVQYDDGKTQTVHYYITKAATEAVSNLGNFVTTEQWYTNKSDPFGRAPSVMTYDYEEKAIVTQDARAWVAGLSDEAGAGSFLAASMKQFVQPNAGEISKLESFVDGVLFTTIQTPDFSVRKSIFFYEPAAVPGYQYDSSIDWTSWTSWNKEAAYATDRAYDYVHVAASYWALYRAGRAYPGVLKSHTWDWYLNQAYQTIMRAMKPDVGYNDEGLMGETVFGEILTDLERENQTSKANTLTAAMKIRATNWDSEEVPFGSEMAWDSTGHEGIYYWAKYFGLTNTTIKTVNSVLGFMPAIPHWGWNGNARRYWDNMLSFKPHYPSYPHLGLILTMTSYGGKLQRIERQIHHYGSGLNALVLLSAFRSDPSDSYLIRVGYGGTSGPLSNINNEGFAAASFHSWPDTLKWDGYSGDYGPNFVGLALGSGTYLVDDKDLGIVAYGGVLTSSGSNVTVKTRDPLRRKIFIGPLGAQIKIDAGLIECFTYNAGSKSVSITLSKLADAPDASAAIVWVETTSGKTQYKVMTAGLKKERLGWKVPLSSGSVTVQIGAA